MDRTSTWLLGFFTDPEISGLGREELQEMRDFREELMKSVECLWNEPNQSAFSFLDYIKQFNRNARAYAERVLDDSLCYMLIERVPEMVSRALRLEPLVVSGDLSPLVDVHLREGTRAYLFGLFNASVALCRSALEQALEDKVPKGLQTPSREDHLQNLIKRAELSKVLQHDFGRMADEVRRSANKVVHGQMCDESEGSDILVKTRKVLRALYRTKK